MQAIAILKKGAYQLKYGRHGKPKFYPFRLSSDDTYLIWYCGRKEKRLKLNSVTRIIPGQGQRTVIFRRYPQPTKEYQSFSLIYGNRSLDLVFKDKNEAEFWITTLRTLLSRNSSSALVLHSRSRSFVLDYGEQSSSSNNFRSAGSDTSCEEHAKRLQDLTSTHRIDLGVITNFSTKVTLSLDELVHKPHNMSPENLETRPTNHSHAGPQEMVSSAVSSSSQGSIIENLKDRCSAGEKNLVEVCSSFPYPNLIHEFDGSSVELADCGEFNTCAVIASGDLYAWGDGAHNAGLLGLGSETSHWKPVRILGQMEAAVVSVSGDATSSGKLFVWGDGADEKLGHDDNKESRLIPSCVITTLDTTSLVDRTLLLCNGVLDPSHHNVVRAPSCIEGGLGKSFVQKVACGFHHIAVLNSKAEVYTWGRRSNGQLGHKDTKYRCMPTLVRALKGHPFNYMRKLHNCYNSGSVLCASKKSLAAAMAPKTNRPYRVYDDCYIKLVGAREYLGTPASSARFSNVHLPSSINEMDAIGTTPQRQLLRIYDLKTSGGSHITSSLIRYSVTCGLPFSRRGSVELFPLSTKSNPVDSVAADFNTDIADTELLQEGTKKSNQCLNQEISVEKLTRETKQIEAAVLKAHADADKIKCLEEVVSVSGEATSSGKLFVWGDGEDEKLGHDDNKESRLIHLVTSLCNGVLDPSHHNVVRAPSCIEGGLGKSFVQKVACGFHHIAVLNSKAEVYTWGRRSNGQLGHRDTKYRCMTTLVRALKGHPFNYMRKLHNCYNCGSLSCASKKSLAAAMAPKTNRPYRVYDDCYIKLEGAREYLGTPASSARFSNARLPSSINEMDAIGTTPQRGSHISSSLIRHSVTCGLPFSRRGSVELFPLSTKSNPVDSVAADFNTDIADTELLQEGTKKSNQCLNQEISVLKAFRLVPTILNHVYNFVDEDMYILLRWRSLPEKQNNLKLWYLTLQIYTLMDATKKEVDKTKRRRSSF
ncbi:hypothetical protein HID58_042693 [Brassica napus]|uniref:PH domain-containing protein n=1 Tax=Brassica napus TaxID=3708 RepID=A0ABQ8BG31_BRANA|nr:hypothetical protein HID58_042693 [Brassica napus]